MSTVSSSGGQKRKQRNWQHRTAQISRISKTLYALFTIILCERAVTFRVEEGTVPVPLRQIGSSAFLNRWKIS